MNLLGLDLLSKLSNQETTTTISLPLFLKPKSSLMPRDRPRFHGSYVPAPRDQTSTYPRIFWLWTGLAVSNFVFRAAIYLRRNGQRRREELEETEGVGSPETRSTVTCMSWNASCVIVGEVVYSRSKKYRIKRLMCTLQIY
jgi:hypothetical protein